MAKDESKKYLIPYQNLCRDLSKGKIPNNILIFSAEKLLIDEIINLIGKKFIGKSFNSTMHLKKFYSNEKELDALISECDNIDLFAGRKIIFYKIMKKPGVKGLTKDEKLFFTKYFNNYNSEVILILCVGYEDFQFSNFEDIMHKNCSVYIIDTGSSQDLFEWVKKQFDDYKIDDSTIYHLMRFLNTSYDEIHTEIDKLKMFCIKDKSIKEQDVNLCVGFSRDFDEKDFLESVFSRNIVTALKIYRSLSLKEDVEIYILFLLSSALSAINKLKDPLISSLNVWDLKRELKLWYDFEKLIPVYKKYASEINELQLKSAFDYIYRSEKSIKSINPDKKTVIAYLIENLANL